jgi:hypothetical protein
MVREWLREQGFDMRIGGLLHAGRYLVEWEPIESAWRSTEASLYAVAQYRNQSVQSLLREINPRMRKGMPSEAAINACPFWLVRDSETHEIELHLVRGGRLYSVSDCAEKLGGRVVVNHLQCIVMEWERLSPLYLKDFGDVMQYWPCPDHHFGAAAFKYF